MDELRARAQAARLMSDKSNRGRLLDSSSSIEKCFPSGSSG